jgi:hypothetical protein
VSGSRRAHRKKRKETLEIRENPRREKKLESGKMVVEQLKSGKVPIRSNNWIKDQPRQIQGRSGKT